MDKCPWRKGENTDLMMILEYVWINTDTWGTEKCCNVYISGPPTLAYIELPEFANTDFWLFANRDSLIQIIEILNL